MLDLLDPNRTAVAALGQAASAGPVALATGKLRALLGDVQGARSDLAIAQRLAREGEGRLALVRIRLAKLTLEPPTAARARELQDVAQAAEQLGMQGVFRAALQAAWV